MGEEKGPTTKKIWNRILKYYGRRTLATVNHMVYPDRCVFCDGVLPYHNPGICSECAQENVYLLGPKCMKCGKRLPEEEMEYCVDCERIHHLYQRGVSLYDYEKVSESLYRFKYGNRSSYATFFGEEIAYYLGDLIRSWEIDGILPVPMYAAKERRRGYNQAACLAKSVGKCLGIPVLDGLVQRTRNTIPLKNLNPQQRRNNLKNAFKIVPFGVKLERIIIMDDIYTTGSTVDEIAELLLRNGCEKIYVITLAIGSGV